MTRRGPSRKLFFYSLILCATAFSQEVRPVRDDVGYCWTVEQMKRLVEYLGATEKDSMPRQSIAAAVSPHDDYLYAARIYYPLFEAIRAKEAVIFGVTHGTVRKEIGNPQSVLILEEYSAWHGLTNDVSISPLRDFIKSRLDTSYFLVSNEAHQLEHSIQGLIPFFQYFNPDFRLTPIMVTAMSFERTDSISSALAEIIADYAQKEHLVVGRDLVFLMSSDANHYGKDFHNVPFGSDSRAHGKAILEDLRISKTYLADVVAREKVRGLVAELKNVAWCGRYSVSFGLLTAQMTIKRLTGREITGTVMRYSDSYTEGVLPLSQSGMGTTAPSSLKHWVGYLSAAFYLK